MSLNVYRLDFGKFWVDIRKQGELTKNIFPSRPVQIKKKIALWADEYNRHGFWGMQFQSPISFHK